MYKISYDAAAVLAFVDQELSNEIRSKGCPQCAGPLYQANYLRKSRGLDPIVSELFFSKRFSLCCGRDGCRIRVTPQSVRFLGRSLFPGLILVLVGCIAEGRRTRECLGLLEESFGISRRSLERWRKNWKLLFHDSKYWLEKKAALFSAMDIQRPTLNAFVRAFKLEWAAVQDGSMICMLKFLPARLAPD